MNLRGNILFWDNVSKRIILMSQIQFSPARRGVIPKIIHPLPIYILFIKKTLRKMLYIGSHYILP